MEHGQRSERYAQRGLVVAALVAYAVLAAPAQAQQSNPPEQPTASQVSDETLRAFAVTAVEVDKVVRKWRPRIDAANSAERAHDLNQRASREVQAAIENGPVSEQQYERIFRLMHRDPAVADRIEAFKQQVE